MIYICRSIGRSVSRYVCHGPKCVGRIKWPTRMLKVILGQLKMTCDTRVIHFDYALEQLARTKKKLHLATLKRVKRGDENELERNLRLEKVVASKQLRFVETEEERRARLENDAATKRLRLAMEMDKERKA